MSIGDKQIQIINNAKNYLKNLISHNIDSSLSSFCYFSSWAEAPGYARLKLQTDGWFFIIKFCIILLKKISDPTVLSMTDILMKIRRIYPIPIGY